MRAVRSRVVQALSQTPSTGLRRPSLEEGAGKRCSECDSVCLSLLHLSVCFSASFELAGLTPDLTPPPTHPLSLIYLCVY